MGDGKDGWKALDEWMDGLLDGTHWMDGMIIWTDGRIASWMDDGRITGLQDHFRK